MPDCTRGSVLVTGASGLLGRYALARLRDAGLEPIPLDLRNSRPSLASPRDLDARPRGLIHLAAQRPRPQGIRGRELYETNVQLAKRAIETAKALRARHWVLASSVSVYGDLPARTITENTPPHPQGPYAESKLTSEELFLEEARSAAAVAVVLRFTHLYGLGERPDFLLSIAIHNASKGLAIRLRGRGSGRRNLLYALDGAEALACSLDAPESLTVNILGPRCYTNLEAALTIAQGFGCGSEVLHEDYEEDSTRTESVRSLRASQLGFKAAFTLEEAVRHMKDSLTNE